MDASRRSLHVYGKTAAGSQALGAARGALSSSSRQLLILIDGHRTLGELQQMFPGDTFAAALDTLESQGLIECLRHIPDEGTDVHGDPAVTGERAAGAAGDAAFEFAARASSAPDATQGAAAAEEAGAPTTQMPAAAGRAERRKRPRTPLPIEMPLAEASLPPIAEGVGAELDNEGGGRGMLPIVLGGIVVFAAIGGVLFASGGLGLFGSTRPDAPPATTIVPAAPAQPAEPAAEANGGANGAANTGANSASATPAASATTPNPARGAPPVDVTAAVPPPPVAPETVTTQTNPAAAPSAADAAQVNPIDAAAAPSKAAAPKTAPPAPDKPTARNAAKPLKIAPPAPSAANDAAPMAPKAPSLHVRNQVMPQLPKLALNLGIASGHVVVLLHVNPDGTVERVELVSATPPQVYDAAMERAFQQWTFDPLGIPGRMTVEIEVRPPRGK
jgi:TonB family protein